MRYLVTVTGPPERGYGLLAKAGIHSLVHPEPGHLTARVSAESPGAARDRVAGALEDGYEVGKVLEDGTVIDP